MGTRIFTNVDSLRGLFSLQKSNSLQSQTLQRLSTGTKINSGSDDPAGLIASQTLQSQITAIQQSITNSNRANNVIGTADAALGQVGNLLDQIRGLVQQGVNSGALSQTEIQANQSQIDAALSAINRIAGNTEFAGSKLLDGSKSFTTTISSADAAKISDFQVNEALFGSSPTVTLDAQVVTAAQKASLTYNGGNLTAATTLEVAGAKGSQVLFFGNGTTYTNLNNAINNVSDVTGVTSSITTAAVASTATKTAGGETITDNFETLQTGTGGADNLINFTAKRAAAVGGSPISVSYVAGAGTAARSIGVVGNAITVTLATTGGVIDATETATNIAAAINANGSAGALVSASTVGAGGAGLVAAVGSTNLAAVSNSGLQFVAKRVQADGTNPISVNFVAGAGTAARSVAVVGNAITVTLATTAGVVNNTETATSIASYINTNGSAGAIAARALVNTYAGAGVDGDGSGVVAAKAAVSLAGGTNNDVHFVDARQDAGASDTPVTVTYVNSGTANSALSISVTGSDITVNLATNAAGVATTTANQLVTFINTDASAGAVAAKALVTATAGAGVEGDGSGALAAAASTALTGGADAVLTLSSSSFGSKQFVSINVLNGTFATYDPTSTAANRSIGADIVARINGQNALGDGLKASISTALLSGSISFNSSNNVALAEARVTVTGGGSLFQIGENVSTAGQIGVGIEAVNTARLGGVAGKLYELGSGAGKSLLDVGPSVQGTQLVDIISQAADRVNTLRARLGALQKNVIATNVDSLNAALTNITDAKSQISDTDFAAETANLTKAQILNQAGISTLQIANSAPQQVLTLLRQ